MSRKTLKEALDIKSWDDPNLKQSIKDYYNQNIKGKTTVKFSEYAEHMENIKKLQNQKSSRYDTLSSILSQTPLFLNASKPQQNQMLDSLKLYIKEPNVLKSFLPKALEPFGRSSKSSFSKKDEQDLLTAKENLNTSIELNELDGIKLYAKRIIDIDPSLSDSLKQLIKDFESGSEEEKNKHKSGGWFSKLKSKIKSNNQLLEDNLKLKKD